MILGSTQPLTEMCTRNLPGGRWQSERTADNLTVIYEPIVYAMWESRRLTTLWASTAYCRYGLPFFTLPLLEEGLHVCLLILLEDTLHITCLSFR
jgi:hypothetical protein